MNTHSWRIGDFYTAFVRTRGRREIRAARTQSRRRWVNNRTKTSVRIVRSERTRGRAKRNKTKRRRSTDKGAARTQRANDDNDDNIIIVVYVLLLLCCAYVATSMYPARSRRGGGPCVCVRDERFIAAGRYYLRL